MKSPFSGLSLFIHILVILVATVVALMIGQRRVETFKRSLSADGSVRRDFFLRNFSIAIILLLGVFILFATSVAIKTGIREGARESHSEYIINGYHTLIEASVATSAFIAENVNADTLPDFASRSATFVRADTY